MDSEDVRTSGKDEVNTSSKLIDEEVKEKKNVMTDKEGSTEISSVIQKKGDEKLNSSENDQTVEIPLAPNNTKPANVRSLSKSLKECTSDRPKKEGGKLNRAINKLSRLLEKAADKSEKKCDSVLNNISADIDLSKPPKVCASSVEIFEVKDSKKTELISREDESLDINEVKTNDEKTDADISRDKMNGKNDAGKSVQCESLREVTPKDSKQTKETVDSGVCGEESLVIDDKISDQLEKSETAEISEVINTATKSLSSTSQNRNKEPSIESSNKIEKVSKEVVDSEIGSKTSKDEKSVDSSKTSNTVNKRKSSPDSIKKCKHISEMSCKNTEQSNSDTGFIKTTELKDHISNNSVNTSDESTDLLKGKVSCDANETKEHLPRSKISDYLSKGKVPVNIVKATTERAEQRDSLIQDSDNKSLQIAESCTIGEPLKTPETTVKSSKTIEKTNKLLKNVEKIEKTSKSAEKTDKSAKTIEKTDKSAKTIEKTDKSAKTIEKTDKSAKTAEKTDKSTKTVEKTDKSTKTVEKTDKSTKTVEKTDKSTKTVEKTDNKPTKNITKSVVKQHSAKQGKKGEISVDKNEESRVTDSMKDNKKSDSHDKTNESECSRNIKPKQEKNPVSETNEKNKKKDLVDTKAFNKSKRSPSPDKSDENNEDSDDEALKVSFSKKKGVSSKLKSPKVVQTKQTNKTSRNKVEKQPLRSKTRKESLKELSKKEKKKNIDVKETTPVKKSTKETPSKKDKCTTTMKKDLEVEDISKKVSEKETSRSRKRTKGSQFKENRSRSDQSVDKEENSSLKDVKEKPKMTRSTVKKQAPVDKVLEKKETLISNTRKRKSESPRPVKSMKEKISKNVKKKVETDTRSLKRSKRDKVTEDTVSKSFCNKEVHKKDKEIYKKERLSAKPVRKATRSSDRKSSNEVVKKRLSLKEPDSSDDEDISISNEIEELELLDVKMKTEDKLNSSSETIEDISDKVKTETEASKEGKL